MIFLNFSGFGFGDPKKENDLEVLRKSILNIGLISSLFFLSSQS